MPSLTRYQQPELRLPLAWKIILALLALILLVMFKNTLYNLEKNENEKSGQNAVVSHGAVITPASGTTPSEEKAGTAPAIPPTIPAPIPAPAAVAVIGKLKILNTPTGFLNVRDTPSSAGQVINQVSPGSILSYTAQQDGWYQITLPTGATGWVSAQYVTTDLAASPAPTITPKPYIYRGNDGDGGDE